MRIASPPGYGRVVPFAPQAHSGLGLAPGGDHAWSESLNAVFVNAAEFVKAAIDYPLAFTRDPASREFIPVAVLGLRAKENLFVEGGRWRDGAYVPAYVRRHPFCIAEFRGQDGEASRQMVCVEEARLSRGPPPLFDAHGEATAAWTPILRLVESIETARQQTRVLCRRLDALGLLVPFDAVATPRIGRPMRLTGLLRVDEPGLERAPGRALRTMMQKGELRAVYAHLVSLENFAKLMTLAASRDDAPRRAGGTR